MNKPIEFPDREKERMLHELSAKMQEIRDAKPDEAAIQRAKDAIERLLAVAQRDTGQSRRVANFLLAWWNAQECGGFDFADMWAVDLNLAQDMVTVFTLLSNFQHYPDSQVFGYGKQFERLAKTWRPHKEP
jgi:hypothetical protein